MFSVLKRLQGTKKVTVNVNVPEPIVGGIWDVRVVDEVVYRGTYEECDTFYNKNLAGNASAMFTQIEEVE